MIEVFGGCLCESVRYRIMERPISQGICYCRQCQKTGGTFGSAMMVLHKETFDVSHGSLSSCKTIAERGSTVTRNFCRDCGSHIFAEISDIPDLITIRAASLDNFELFVPDYLVWTRSAGPLCPFPAGVPSFQENAPLEMVLGLKKQS